METKKNRIGHPIMLTQELIDKGHNYVEECIKAFIVVKEGASGKDGEPKWRMSAPLLPNQARLCLTLDINHGTIASWTKERENETEEERKLRESFTEMVARVKLTQEAMLCEFGASGVYNPAVTNRILSANFGYKDAIPESNANKPIPSTGDTIPEPVKKAVSKFEEEIRGLLIKK